MSYDTPDDFLLDVRRKSKHLPPRQAPPDPSSALARVPDADQGWKGSPPISVPFRPRLSPDAWLMAIRDEGKGEYWGDMNLYQGMYGEADPDR
jgi:hypothetical protein